MSVIKNLFEKYAKPYLNGKGMKGNVARGGILLGIGGGSENALRLARNMILARILAPEAFGLLAIILAVNAFFESFTQIGLREAIIQNPKGSEYVFLNAAFWVSSIRGLFLFICSILMVPYIAAFYQKPELVPMMRIAFLSILFLGFVSPRAYSAMKQMKYRKWVMIYHLGSIVGIITAIALGIHFKTVWALVIGFTVENGARFLLSYIVCPFLPSFKIDRESLYELIKFARGIFGLPILMFLYLRTDVFVLGKTVSASMLGIYSIVISLVQSPTLIFNVIFNPIILPVLSKYKSDKIKFRDAIFKISQTVSLIFVPFFTLLAVFSPILLKLLYGQAYVRGSVAFQILSISMVLKLIGAVIMNTFYALGMPQMSRNASIARLAVLLATIVPLVTIFGINGAATASAISAFFMWIIMVHRVTKLNIGFSSVDYFKSIRLGGIVSLCIIALSHIVILLF